MQLSCGFYSKIEPAERATAEKSFAKNQSGQLESMEQRTMSTCLQNCTRTLRWLNLSKR